MFVVFHLLQHHLGDMNSDRQTFNSKRRGFLQDISLMAAMAMFAPTLLGADLRRKEPLKDLFENNKNRLKFLFQGDSITDGNRARDRDWNHIMGHGYQYIIASNLWYGFPQMGLKFFNRGISGNTVLDLVARWREDTLDLKPDILSILIGVNDVTKYIDGNEHFSSSLFQGKYEVLLKQARDELPSVQLVLCEPFLLPVGKVEDRWREYSREMEERQEIVKGLALKYDAVFVHFQKAFNKALERAPTKYWIWDGVHPMPAGHELMAREWIQQVDRVIKLIR